MATFTWEMYTGAGPTFTSIASNTIVFSGDSTDNTTPVTVSSWQDGTHYANGSPGTDQCGANHAPNVKYISSTQMDTGGGTENITDANLSTTECSLRIRFTDGSSVATSNARFYAFNSTTSTTRATGVDMVAFERGVSATSWTIINDDTTSGALTTGSTGGDNSGHRLDLQDQGAATDHTFYLALSASPESVGGKNDFDLGIALTYS